MDIILRQCAAISLSIPFKIVPECSIIFTQEPSRVQTEPNSKPMTPAPMTSKFFGTEENDNAPVEDTMTCSSKSIDIPGKPDASDPVAMTIFFASIVSSEELPLTSILLLDTILADP
ncbi:hypothetical protein FXW27_04445 [Candidatus Liberibacter asiaticus]|nr:hypothetical protein FXW27_04445 [Candidatus Liberibacter asiaticus]